MHSFAIRSLRRAILAHGADAFLLINHEYSGQPGTRYLTGFSGSESLFVATSKAAYLITDGRYFLQVRRETKGIQLIKAQGVSSFALLKDLSAKLRFTSFLVDSSKTSYGFVHRLQAHHEGVKVVGIEGLLQELREVKTKEEILLIAKAHDIAGKAFAHLLSLIKSGVTEQWLAAKLHFLMKEAGAESAAFPAIVASGKNGALPHAKPSTKKIKKGEFITIDFGAYYKGYASDITRTVVVGEVPYKLKKIYALVKRAQELGCRKARAGMTGKALDAVCRAYITRHGFGEYFLHSTGHGLGMEVHESPSVSPSNTHRMPLNSVVTCEPGIYVHGFGGVRIEDALALTKHGNVNLARRIPKDLIKLG